MTSTPLIESRALAKLFNFGRVLLKLENSQPTGSFKDRAMRSKCSAVLIGSVQRRSAAVAVQDVIVM